MRTNRSKAAQAFADSWSAGFACKRKQSLHSRCNKVVFMNMALGIPQILEHNDGRAA